MTAVIGAGTHLYGLGFVKNKTPRNREGRQNKPAENTPRLLKTQSLHTTATTALGYIIQTLLRSGQKHTCLKTRRNPTNALHDIPSSALCLRRPAVVTPTVQNTTHPVAVPTSGIGSDVANA